MCWATVWANFFTKPSGHPVCSVSIPRKTASVAFYDSDKKHSILKAQTNIGGKKHPAFLIDFNHIFLLAKNDF
jgi:hypothetical protein